MSNNSKELNDKLKVVQDLISECEQIALKNKEDFYFSVEYGMGGTFHGGEELKEYKNMEEYEEDNGEKYEFGWRASSESC